jgi:hypothetical protein
MIFVKKITQTTDKLKADAEIITISYPPQLIRERHEKP